jgi:hypothetical protein
VDPPEVLGEGVPPEAAETTAGVVGHTVVLVVLDALGVELVVVDGVPVVEVVVDAGTVVVVETTAAAVRGAVVVVVEVVLDVLVVELGMVVEVVLEFELGVVVEVVLDVLVVHGVVVVVLVVELGTVVVVVLVVEVVVDGVVVLVLVDVLVANPLAVDGDAAPTSPTEPHDRTAEIKMIPDANRNNRSIRLSFPPEPAGPGRLVQALRRRRPIRPSNGTPLR